MGGLAADAWAFGRWSSRLRAPMLAYVGVELLIAVVAMLFPTAADAILGLSSGARIATAIALLLTPTFLMGGTLRTRQAVWPQHCRCRCGLCHRGVLLGPAVRPPALAQQYLADVARRPLRHAPPHGLSAIRRDLSAAMTRRAERAEPEMVGGQAMARHDHTCALRPPSRRPCRGWSSLLRSRCRLGARGAPR